MSANMTPMPSTGKCYTTDVCRLDARLDVSKLGEGEMIAPPMRYDVLIAAHAGHHFGWPLPAVFSTFGLVHFNICTPNKVGKLHLAEVSLFICK